MQKPGSPDGELVVSGSLEGHTAVMAESKTEESSARISFINQGIEIHSVFLTGKEIILPCYFKETLLRRRIMTAPQNLSTTDIWPW